MQSLNLFPPLLFPHNKLPLKQPHTLIIALKSCSVLIPNEAAFTGAAKEHSQFTLLCLRKSKVCLARRCTDS